MANTQSLCTSFLVDLLQAKHNFGTSPTRATTDADVFKCALYFASATLNASTSSYTPSGEVSGTGYTAGGATLLNTAPPSATNTSPTAGTAFWTPSGSVTYTNITISTPFDAVLIYNSTQADRAVGVYTFGAQVITAGTMVIVMPPNTPTNALLRLTTT